MPREIDLSAERSFENSKVSGANPRSKQARFYWATELGAERFMKSLERKVAGKKVLEVGCSNGQLALLLSKKSKRYIGLDISDEAIKQAQLLKLANTDFICTDGHSIPFPDESFDLVITSGVLHHLDLDSALPEISRILRRDGLLAFDEPLGINPIFNLYRVLTPAAPTADEKPFGPSEIRKLKNFFSLKDVDFFGCFAILSAFGESARLRRFLSVADNVLSSLPLKWLMWRFAGFAVKAN